MRVNDRSKRDFDRAKIKLTGHFDRRPTGRYFEPCIKVAIVYCFWSTADFKESITCIRAVVVELCLVYAY